jgi:N-acetylmuramoyl-L-alanine amidase
MLIAARVKEIKGFVTFWVMSLLLTLTGCHLGTQTPGSGGLSDADRMMPLTELASLLGLSVSDTSPSFVTLKNNTDTVMVFTFSDGQFYVNGKAGGPVGAIGNDDRGLLVEKSLLTRITPFLQPGNSGAASGKPIRPQRGLIVIDPGHGGKDPGAVSCLGYHEKEVNLAVAKYLDSMLRQKGFETILTRRSDVYVSLGERADLANRHGADLFVSVHADSVDSSSPKGFTVYTARMSSKRSIQVGQSIVQELAGTGTSNRGLRKANYQVLIKTQCPSVLIEMGYLSNLWEAQRLRDANMQHRLAQAIATGIQRFADKHKI